jgi:hypothetical protein
MESTDLSPEENLWRYLDLGKFLELISARSLYLTREPFRIKRISFSHEQEVRLITQDMPITNSVDGRKRFDMSSPNDRLGKSIQLAHFEDLIEEIRLSPFAAPWLHRTLSDLLQKLGVTIPINKSEIEIYPFAAH